MVGCLSLSREENDNFLSFPDIKWIENASSCWEDESN